MVQLALFHFCSVYRWQSTGVLPHPGSSDSSEANFVTSALSIMLILNGINATGSAREKDLR